ncbi:glycoside hydrolase family 113 [Aquimarina rubra]|uniref:Glycoside hydrolase family 5 domain-containing protein n=1 Tax=Aquimarina rubra TaxID=1920033 RepID=A0ABW5LE16_9FLAO
MKKELFTALSVYIFTWLMSLVLFIIGGVSNGITFYESIKYFGEASKGLNFQIALHVLFIILYFLFLIFRYFIRVQKKKGFKVMIKNFSLRLFTPALVLFGIFKIIIAKNSSENFEYDWIPSIENNSGIAKELYETDGKHRGMTVFGWNYNNNHEVAIDDIIRSNIEWVAVVPFMDQEDEKTLTMRIPKNLGQWSKRDSLHIKTITNLKAKNIRIMLKPHLWLGTGWRSNITHSSTSDWDIWFESYRMNMIHYAKMAAKTDVALFCIGTELNSSIVQQPERWKSLIKEIKTIYKGKLTYAANWDGEYEFIDFWNELDYIGIQAYFPLTESSNPDISAIKKGWNIHVNLLESLSKKHNKQILFTEIGYKSEASATIKPWEWGSALSILSKQKSDKTQQIAYQALYETFWDKDWFAGTYIWQWNTQSKKENASTNLDFSPRYKPAENTIAKWYATSSCD